MRVAAYVRLPWTRPPLTGVGRHAVCVIRELSQLEPVTLIPYRWDLTAGVIVPEANALAGFAVSPIPVPHYLIERCWHVLHTPAIDVYAKDADWVYVPFECYVPSRRPRVAVTVHDLHALEPDLPWSDTPVHRSFARRWRRKLKPIVRHADVLLAVSDYTKSRIVELLGVSPDRVAVVGNGVDELFFTPPPTLSDREVALHGNRPYVLLTGGLTRKKGGQYVLPIAEQLARESPDLRLVVVGYRNEPDLEERGRSIGNFVFAGHVDDALYHALLGRAQALLFLSRYEGFGIPTLEAMAMGVPVIASRFCSLPEVVGDAGFLVDPTATQDIAALIVQLCETPASCDAMVARGRRRAAEAGWRRCAERVQAALLARQ
jgi:glycosyltransferase involved in cell wall biosynthesis